MIPLTINQSRLMKLLSVISLAAPLFGCGASEEHLLGQLGDNHALAKAEIVMTGSKGILNLEYHQGFVWPDIHVEVDVKKIPNGYQITRLDEKTKLEFIQADAFLSTYVCGNCETYYGGQMPTFWNLK